MRLVLFYIIIQLPFQLLSFTFINIEINYSAKMLFCKLKSRLEQRSIIYFYYSFYIDNDYNKYERLYSFITAVCCCCCWHNEYVTINIYSRIVDLFFSFLYLVLFLVYFIIVQIQTIGRHFRFYCAII